MQRQVCRRTKEAEHTSGAANQSSSLGMGAWKHEPNKSTVQLTSLTSADHLSVSLLLRQPNKSDRCYPTSTGKRSALWDKKCAAATGTAHWLRLPCPVLHYRRRPRPAITMPMAGRGERSSENVRHARSLAGAGATTYERKRSTRPYQCMARARRRSSPPPAAASRNGIRPLACFDRP